MFITVGSAAAANTLEIGKDSTHFTLIQTLKLQHT
jgi:hypothetical protein